MTISVSIATYNREPMVCQAVLAALASKQVTQVVVSDDASSDGTVQAIESLARADARVHLVRQTRNSGGVGNWNAGLDATRGDLIALCSDDDRFLPEHIEASAAYLKANPEVGLVHSSFIDAIETAGGELREPRPLRPASVLTRSGLIPYLIRYFDWPFHPSTIVLRRSVWEQVGPFDPSYEFADTEWFIRVVEKFPVAFLARHGVLNRRHPGNWSNRCGSAHLQRERFLMGEAAITRGPQFGLTARAFWRAIWRANTRARLALTLRARLNSGHEEAACAAWHGILQDTGRRTPVWIERAGVAIIRRVCAGRAPEFQDQRQRVSPL